MTEIKPRNIRNIGQNYDVLTTKLREEVKKLLQNPDIKYAIGWQLGSYGLRISPAFIEESNDVEKLVWSPFCINSLAVYPTLEEKPPLPRGAAEDLRRIVVMVKGCDSRGLVQMFIENGYRRERIVIIGIPCTGQIDPEKLMPRLKEKGISKQINLSDLEVIDQIENFKFKVFGKELEIPKLEIIYNKCSTCKYPNPILSDILLTAAVKPRGKIGEGYEKVSELDSMGDSDRWSYWAEKFDRCIRCYGCRNICPVCYCKECLSDKWEPDWINKSVNLTENAMFHITRAYHLIGRCVSCHECERACPVGIPLLDIYKKMEMDILDKFNYEPGTNQEAKTLLTTFNPDDPGEFIL